MLPKRDRETLFNAVAKREFVSKKKRKKGKGNEALNRISLLQFISNIDSDESVLRETSINILRKS